MNPTYIAKVSCAAAIFLPAALTVLAAAPEANYDEAKVRAYTLPDPLMCHDGVRVADAATWTARRRPELLELYRSEIFGRIPSGLPAPKFVLQESSSNALSGTATRKQVAILLAGTNGGPTLNLLVYVPNNRKASAPGFLSLNFGGNHTVTTDPAVFITTNWVGKQFGSNNRANAEGRGLQASRWPIQRIIERGFAVATAYYGDVEPDFDEGWKTGVRGWFGGTTNPFAPDAWGAISAWAWGLSRAMDYLQSDREIDSKRIVVLGHSRLGKTALWAGAQDERFAAVISNNSGEGGAALARRNFGETTERLNTRFPHWFCGNFKRYSNDEEAMPVDAHMLLALTAPRPIYVASASEDLWADPKGEFLALKAAEPVYKLFSIPGLPAAEMPEPDAPVSGKLSYHRRKGPHDILQFDWDQYMTFVARNVPASPAR